jgi:hypothetical protein
MTSPDKPRFAAPKGGRVHSLEHGRTVVTIHVDDMTLAEALRIQTAVLAALEAEFADDPTTPPRPRS